MKTSGVVAWGSVAQGMQNFPGTGIDPISPALAGRFLTTDYQRSSLCSFFDWIVFFSYSVYGCVLSHFSRVQLFATLDYSPLGSSVHGIFQARILGWVAMSSSRGSSDPRIEPTVLMSPAMGGRFFTTGATWEAHSVFEFFIYFDHYPLSDM